MHDFVKIRANIHYDREIGRVLRAAASGLEYVRTLLGKQGKRSESSATLRRRGTLGKRRTRVDDFGSTDFLSERKAATPSCISCQTPVSMPCWYCVDCPRMCHFRLIWR